MWTARVEVCVNAGSWRISSSVPHHNRATIEGEAATGMFQLLYIEWGGYYFKKLPSQYSCMRKCRFLHFWSNCEHQRDFYFWENSAKKGKKIADIHKSWFLDMSVIINWIAVVLYVFQAQAVSKKSQLLCIQQLRGTDAAVYSPVLLLLSSHHVTVSPLLRGFFTRLPYLSQTLLWKQSFVRDHWTFLFSFFKCSFPLKPTPSTVVVLPLHSTLSSTTSGSHQVIQFQSIGWSTWWWSWRHFIVFVKVISKCL